MLEVPVAEGSPAEAEHANRAAGAAEGGSAVRGDGADPRRGYSPLSRSAMVRGALQPLLSVGMEGIWAASSLPAPSPAP